MTNAKFVSDAGEAVIAVTLVETARAYLPSVRLWFEVHDGAFTAEKDGWFGYDEFHAFVEQVAEIERTRVGTATLSSLSPDEDALSLHPAGDHGTFALAYQFVHPYYARTGLCHRTLTGTFDLDPGGLLVLVTDLRRMRYAAEEELKGVLGAQAPLP